MENIERIVATHNYSASAVERYVMHYASVNLYTPAILRAPVFKPITASSVIDRRIVLASEFYNDFLRPEGTGPGGVAMNVAANAKSVATVSIQYGADAEPALDALYGIVLSRVGAHLARAAALAGRVEHGAPARASLQAIHTPALLLGETGTVLEANHAAQAILARGPLTLGFGGLMRAGGPEDQRALDGAAAQAVAHVPRSGLVRLRSPRRDGDLTLSLVPLRDERRRPRVWTLADEAERAAAVVHIAAEGREVDHLIPSLERLYGLEETDALIAVGCYRGRRLPEIATTLGMTHYAAALRLERVLDKLGAERVVDLVRRIAMLARVQPAPADPPR
jgi:hypothetical protein